MRRAIAVIGAAFGDEGKGLATDYFAHRQSQFGSTLVVRHNGGAQAGHTVVTPDGSRHVFSHLGSGSLAGVPSLLGPEFIVNPISFTNEYKSLSKFNANKSIYVDSNCAVTTPLDMIYNQFKHMAEKNPHGSCGMGVFETLSRHSNGIRLFAKNLFNFTRSNLYYKYNDIVGYYLKKFEDNATSDHGKVIHFGKDLMDDFFRAVDFFVANAIPCDSIETINEYQSVVFEGAQGLLLDRDNREFFPNLTPSKTGSHNVDALLDKIYNSYECEFVYVMRPYMTRHGNGAFPSENRIEYEDDTNLTNQFQGHLRFGSFDYELIKKSINNDSSISNSCYKKSIFLTHNDQFVDKEIPIKDGPSLSLTDFQNSLESILPMGHLSYGKTREHVISKML